LDCNSHELSLVITDDDHIQELNKTYRKIDKPTNVLAFPMQEGEYCDITPGLLGDVVISRETAGQEAEKADITLMERVSQLLIHGILHLVGYDHEKGEKASKNMEAKSLELLRIIEPDKKLHAF